MIWVIAIGALIAVFRLLLILFGICALIKALSNHSNIACCIQETRRKFFLGAGILYLLGLLPHALSLLLSVPPNSPEALLLSRCQSNANQQSNSILCWCQRLSCAFSSGIHMVSYLFCALEPLFNKLQQKILLKWRRKLLLNAIMMFFIIIASCQSLWLWPDSGLMQWTYISDSQSDKAETNCGEESDITLSETEAKQGILVELLPCSEYLSSSRMKNYIFYSYATSVSVVIILLATKFKLPSITALSFKDNHLVKEEENALQNKELEQNKLSQCICTMREPQLDGMMNSLCLAIVLWILFLRPMTVAIWTVFSNRFVDFGTHLLLTLNVLIPLTATQPSTENFKSVLL